MPRVRVAVAVGLVVAVLGAFAGGAQAGGRLVRVDSDAAPFTIGGPVLTAGGGVAWANKVGDDYEVWVSSPTAGTSVRRIQGLGHGGTSLGFAASATRVALGLSVVHCTGGNCFDDPQLDARIFAGPLSGRLRRQPACTPRHPQLDLSGDVLAYINPCAGGATVRDLAAPGTAPSISFPADHRVRIAGRYVAVDADTPGPRYPAPLSGKIRVYDRLTGELVYTVEAKNEYAPWFDLRDDGTLVFTRFAGTGIEAHHELSRASPADPTPRRIVDEIPLGVRIAGDTVAIDDAFGLHVMTLDGRGSIAEVRDPEFADYGFDYDGERLAWSVRPCEVTAIVVWDLQGSVPALPGGPCPNATPTRVVQRGRRVLVTLRCHDPERLGCLNSVEVHLPGGVTRMRFFSIRPGHRKTIGLKRLSRSAACALAARRDPHAIATTYPEGQRELADPPVRRRLAIEVRARPGGCPSRRL
jgi:hypothetical protein